MILKDTSIPVFTAALFTIGRAWKQPRCPSTDEYEVVCVCVIYNRTLLSHKKKHI